MIESRLLPQPGTYTYAWRGRRYVWGSAPEVLGPIDCPTHVTVEGDRVMTAARTPTRASDGKLGYRQRQPDGWWTFVPVEHGSETYERWRLLEPVPLPSTGYWTNELERNGILDRITTRILGEITETRFGRELLVVVYEHQHFWSGRMRGCGINTCHFSPELGIGTRDHMRGQTTTDELQGVIVDLEEELVLVGGPSPCPTSNGSCRRDRRGSNLESSRTSARRPARYEPTQAHLLCQEEMADVLDGGSVPLGGRVASIAGL